MRTALVLLIAVALWALLVRLDSHRRARKIEAAFAGRQALDAEEFFEKHFRSSGVSADVVAGVRDVLEKQLQADLSRLRETDDFSTNLSFFWDFDSMADVEIICALEERFRINISNDEARCTKTVADIINLVQMKLTSAPADR